MAYIDANARAKNPAGLFGAVAINALIVGGVILAAPDLVREPPNIIELIGIKAPPPPPAPVADPEPNAITAKPQPFAPKPQSLPAQGENDLAIPPGAGDFGVIPQPGGGIVEQPPQLPPVHQPVLTGAKVHPRYTGVLQPEYPPGEIRAGREGVVIVRVLIGTDGRVKALEPVSSDGDAFLAVTRKQALGKWRFLPATRDGEPVEAWREMTVRFRLPD